MFSVMSVHHYVHGDGEGISIVQDASPGPLYTGPCLLPSVQGPPNMFSLDLPV